MATNIVSELVSGSSLIANWMDYGLMILLLSLSVAGIVLVQLTYEKRFAGQSTRVFPARLWTLQRILSVIWFIGFSALFLVMICPISMGILRLFISVAILGLWLLAMILTRRVKWLAFVILAIGLSIGIFALLPGKPIEPVRLQSEYLKQLKQYEGTPYLWGGENGYGIDCSGLVRRALINSFVRLALTTGNPKALRAGLDLWWHDCSVRALRDQYRDFTFLLFSAPSINTIDNAQLRPGDIAVTSNGVHVLAYLGGQQWIQAEPGIARVVILSIPTDNAWFAVPVKVMRWTYLKETSDESFKYVVCNLMKGCLPSYDPV